MGRGSTKKKLELGDVEIGDVVVVTSERCRNSSLPVGHHVRVCSVGNLGVGARFDGKTHVLDYGEIGFPSRESLAAFEAMEALIHDDDDLCVVCKNAILPGQPTHAQVAHWDCAAMVHRRMALRERPPQSPPPIHQLPKISSEIQDRGGRTPAENRNHGQQEAETPAKLAGGPRPPAARRRRSRRQEEAGEQDRLPRKGPT